MADDFDPYRKWLGIPADEQPPNHYRLLGIGQYEDDPDTIETAADRQMGHLRTFQSGPHSALSQKLLNECATAKICLLNTGTKAAYDRELRHKLAPPPSPPQQPLAVPGSAAATTPRRSVSTRSVSNPAVLILAKPVAPSASNPPAPPTPNAIWPPPHPPFGVTVPGRPKPQSGKKWQRSALIWQAPLVAVLCVALVALLAVLPRHERNGKRDAPAVAPHAKTPLAADGTKPQPPATARRNAGDTNPATPPDSPRLPDSVSITSDGASLDLLKFIDPFRDAVKGTWRFDGQELVAPDDLVAVLQLPHNPPEEFILSMRVRRISGNNTFAIGIPVGTKQVLVALDAHASTVSGLEYLDSRFVQENETTWRGSLFVPNKDVTIIVTVRKDRITCTFDDVKVVDWRGDSQRLSLPETFAVPDRKACFMATVGSSYAISGIVVAPVGIGD